MKKIQIYLLAFVMIAFATSCRKENPNTPAGSTPVKVWLTDAPGNFQQVNVDIIGVEFKNDSGTTVNLNVNAGIYNLLDFTNGIDTLIATGNFPSGILSQVRLILGPNNSVMVDSVLYPLTTPSAQQSGLKINVHDTLLPGVAYYLLLDFDASKSIVLTGNGKYLLKPVIQASNLAASGSIHGTVITSAALPAAVIASDSTNSYNTVTDANGGFLIKGVVPGTYNVVITPQYPYIPDSIPNVVVTVGNLTELGSITF